jgi:ubiquinone biosynthesis accessory factor UbiK
MIFDLPKQLVQHLSEGLASVQPYLPKPDPALLRGWVEAAVEKCQLVSREEFDAQAAVLLRTRLKLEALEQQLARLEAQLETPAPSEAAPKSAE